MTQEEEDWDALVKSAGWLRVIAFVKSQWGSAAYQQKIERAIADAEEKHQDALTAVKIVNSVRREIELIVGYPQQRLEILVKAKERDEQSELRSTR